MTNVAPLSATMRLRQPAQIVQVVGIGSAVAVAIWPPQGAGRLGGLALAVWLLIATVIASVDAREHRIPNSLVAWLSALTLTGIGVAAAEVGNLQSALLVLLGSAATVVVALIIHVASAGAVGMGDVKLLFPVALLLGWFGAAAVWMVVVVTLMLASGVVIYRWLARIGQAPVPLAPYLLAGVAAALIAL